MNKLGYGTVVKIKDTSSIGYVMLVDELLDDVEVRFSNGEYKHFRMKQLEPCEVEEEEVMFRDDLKLGKSETDIGKLHTQICQLLNDICVSKNKDYKNSFSDTWNEFGLISLVIRMNDKMLRIKQLSKYDASVKDESIKDTLMDMANYCILGLIELCKENK